MNYLNPVYVYKHTHISGKPIKGRRTYAKIMYSLLKPSKKRHGVQGVLETFHNPYTTDERKNAILKSFVNRIEIQKDGTAKIQYHLPVVENSSQNILRPRGDSNPQPFDSKSTTLSN